MHVLFWPIVGATAIAIAIIGGPVLISFVIAKQAKLHHQSRRSFILVCTLMAFGIMFLGNVVLLPVEFIAGYSAQLIEDGHIATGEALRFVSKYSSAVSIALGLAASVLIPLRLRRSWNAAWLASR